MKHDQRFIWLDLIRGLSAIAVCAGHLRAATIVNFSEYPSPSIPVQLFYAITGLGHQAVMVFFVLSGLFVGGSILKSGNQFSSRLYGIARLTRLWIVLIPALLLTLIVDLATLRTAPDVAVGKYESTWNSGPKPDGEYSLSAVTFLGNMAFLQTIATPVYGTNGPLWSLANEFWYYVLFPLIAFAAGRIANPGRRWLRLFAVVIAMTLLAFMSMQMILGFVVWLMGVVVYLISNRLEERRRYPHLAFSFTGFVLSLIYSKSTTLENQFLIPSDIVIGIAFAYFCVIMARWPRVQLPVLGNAMARFSIAISEFSYSLYLIHFPFVILIAVTFHLPNKMAPEITGLLTYFGWLSLLLILSGIFWFAFERQTTRVRRLIDRLVPRRLTC